MTRATSVLLYTIPLTILYFLFLLGVISVPIISTQAADEILPVVSSLFLPSLPPFFEADLLSSSPVRSLGFSWSLLELTP